MRQINTNMFHFLKKYSPDYAQNTIEGWSIILVVAVGCEVSSFANSWLGMLGMFVIGVLCAHIIACLIKYCMTNKWFKVTTFRFGSNTFLYDTCDWMTTWILIYCSSGIWSDIISEWALTKTIGWTEKLQLYPEISHVYVEISYVCVEISY